MLPVALRQYIARVSTGSIARAGDSSPPTTFQVSPFEMVVMGLTSLAMLIGWFDLLASKFGRRAPQPHETLGLGLSIVLIVLGVGLTGGSILVRLALQGQRGNRFADVKEVAEL